MTFMPKSEYHLLEAQYPLITMMTNEMVLGKHVFAHVKHGT
jgi:hypothetical protein